MRLSAENLSARRGEDLIFRDVSFVLSAGEALVLTGRNGSGKSTLLRVLAGFLSADSGSARFVMTDGDEARPVREASHYLGHRNGMKRELTVFENLAFWQRFLGDFPGSGSRSLSPAEAAEAVGLGDITHLPYGYLSAGQQRRFAMARLLVAARPVWLLDEPTAAIDASADEIFAGLMGDYRKAGGMIIAATHQPLGLDDARSLVMRGFEYDAAEETT